MRPLRNFTTNRCYHLISRIANRAFFITEEERTRFVERLWRVAAFSGLDVLTYCFMSNHFHILVYVPDEKVALMNVAGYIAIVGGERNRFSPAKQYELLPKGRRTQEAAYKSRMMA